MTTHESLQPAVPEDQSEPEPNTQLSDFGKLMRARFEVADRYADAVLPPAFAKQFRSTMRDLLDQDWNYFGAVDSFIVNSQIPFVNDVGVAAKARGLLTEDEIVRTRPVEVSE